jgi:acetyl esterase/lipase
MKLVPFTVLVLLTVAAAHTRGAGTTRDLQYAEVDGLPLKLDLFLPAAKNPPLIVWIHGGAWRAGSKADMPLGQLVEQGYAVASVDYRLSTVAPFPAQAHDLKGAIRFLRAKASEYSFDGSRIAVAGGSAGGHLAALVGVTNGNKELEGDVGGNLDQKSDVQAIISLFGASDLTKILAQSTAKGREMRAPALQLLLGAQPDEKPELAKLASPVAHVDAHDPPLLLVHGDADPQMPPEQSRELAAAYQKAGLTVRLEIIPGAVHGGPQFFDAPRIALMKSFLDEYLR